MEKEEAREIEREKDQARGKERAREMEKERKCGGWRERVMEMVRERKNERHFMSTDERVNITTATTVPA